MANVKKLIGLFDMSSAPQKSVSSVAQESPVAQTVKDGDKLISTGFDASSAYGKAAINMSNGIQYDMPQTEDLMNNVDYMNVTDNLTPDTQQGIYGQDILDPLDPLNKIDALSPFYNPNNIF